MAGPGGTNSFQYNDQGIRVRTMGTSTKYYLIDANNHTGYQQVLEEFTTLGSMPTRSYVIGDDVLAEADSGSASYLLCDGHGSTRQMADHNAAVTSRYNYDAYGSVQSDTSSSTADAAATSHLYCGEQYDSALQMYNLRARYYSPIIGRFNQRDFFRGKNQDPQSLHKYLYANCDPINGTDPSGQMTMVQLLVISVIVAIVVGVVVGLITKSVKAAIVAALVTFAVVFTVGAVFLTLAGTATAAGISSEAYVVSNLLRTLVTYVIRGQASRAYAVVFALIQTPEGQELVRLAHVACARIMVIYGETMDPAIFSVFQNVLDITKFGG